MPKDSEFLIKISYNDGFCGCLILQSLKYIDKHLTNWWYWMRIKEALERADNRFENGLRKRFACSQCGKIWTEIVGLFAATTNGQEVLVRVGTESEVCQTCRYRMRSCPDCDSKDVYEINFPSNSDSPLSFDGIRLVSNH